LRLNGFRRIYFGDLGFQWLQSSAVSPPRNGHVVQPPWRGLYH